MALVPWVVALHACMSASGRERKDGWLCKSTDEKREKKKMLSDARGGEGAVLGEDDDAALARDVAFH